MSIQQVLAAGRKAAESRMVDACTITRPAGDVLPNGKRSATQVYTGKCEFKQENMLGTEDAESGGHIYTEQSLILRLPIGAGPIKVGDTVACTGAVFNPALPGSVFRVTGLHEGSATTAQRLAISETVS